MGGEKISGLKRDDVRTAVLHLVELAAAFEGHGASLLDEPAEADVHAHFGWEPPPERESFEDDEACLTKVVDLLVKHREKQRLRQRNAILERLLHLLSELYAACDSGEVSTEELRHRLDLMCLMFWIAPEPERLLPPGSKASAPITTAKQVLESVLGLDERTLGKMRGEPQPLDEARRPFGRWVTRNARAAYVLELHEEALVRTERGPMPLWEMKELDEAVGLLQDRRVEAFIGEFGSNVELASLLLPPERRTAFRKRLNMERTEASEALKKAIESGDLSTLPEYLRAAAVAYHSVHRTDSDQSRVAREELDGALERAGRERAVTSFRELVFGVVGPTDAAPALVVEAMKRFCDEAELTRPPQNE